MISSESGKHKRERRARLLCKAINLGLLVMAAWITFDFVQKFVTPEVNNQKGMSIRVAYDRDCATLDWDEALSLAEGESATLKIKAESYWNASGLILKKGETYNFEVKKVLDWKDWGKPANAEGWDEQETGIKLAARSLAREPDKGYFYLMGAIRGSCYDGLICEELFPIGKGTTFKAPADGEFCSFANDIPLMYWNNDGSIILTISRI